MGGDCLTEILTAKIQSAQEVAGKNESEFTRDDFISCYYSQIGISRSVFDEHKRIAREYLESVDASDALDELNSISYYELKHNETMGSEFFGDFNDFFESLTERVNRLSIKVDASVFDAQVATLMLAWAGVQPEDAVNVKKKDVSEYSRTVTANGTAYRIPALGMEPVVRYAKAYRMIKPNNKSLCEMFLKNSEYLFRTFKVEKMTLQSLLAGVTTKLNIVEGKRFHYNNVRLSGVFSRVLLYEQEIGAIKRPPRVTSQEVKDKFAEEMGRVFEQTFRNETLLKQRLSQYKAWKDYFHKKK